MTVPIPKRSEFRVVIADDEVLARIHLRSFFESCEGWRVVGEAASGTEACQLIESLRPDVIFLDIRMPGQTGLGVAKTLSQVDHRPLVVFATAFDEHAVEAFEVEAADYVLKPFDRQRILASVSRLERRLRLPLDPPPLGPNDPSRQRPATEPTGALTLAVKSVGRVRLVDVADVQWIAAAGNYVRLYLDEACVLHRATLAALESQLDTHSFVRIHRSTMVHRGQVVEIRSSAAGRSQVVLRDGTELEISQRFRQRALEALLPPA